MYSGVIRKASEEKFSYLVMQKRPKNSAANFVTTVNAKKGSKKNGKSFFIFVLFSIGFFILKGTFPTASKLRLAHVN